MVKKVEKPSATTSSPLGGAVKDSAQQIWLAGLGAFAKVQEEGGKVFDTLVKEGLAIQRKTQAVAEETLSEATSRLASVATGINSKASGQWDKLEGIFEDRVSKALNKLGIPSAQDIQTLSQRIDTLNAQVAALQTPPKPARPAPAKTAKTTKTATKATPQATSPAAPAAEPAPLATPRRRAARRPAEGAPKRG